MSRRVEPCRSSTDEPWEFLEFSRDIVAPPDTHRCERANRKEEGPGMQHTPSVSIAENPARRRIVSLLLAAAIAL